MDLKSTQKDWIMPELIVKALLSRGGLELAELKEVGGAPTSFREQLPLAQWTHSRIK